MSDRRRLGPGFRALFVGSLISNLGDGMRLAALPLLASFALAGIVLLIAATMMRRALGRGEVSLAHSSNVTT